MSKENKIDIMLKMQADMADVKKATQGMFGLNQELVNTTKESSKLRKASSGVRGAFNMGLGIVSVQMLTRAVQKLYRTALQGVQFNAMIEQQTVAFKTLLGSAAAAEERVKELFAFSNITPFLPEEVLAVSKQMQALTGDALSTGVGLRIVGDAAAAIAGDDLGASFKNTAFWIGRLYAGLKSGAPVGEATARLMELGAISGDTQRKLNDLAKEAQGANRAYQLIEDTFKDFSGAMEEQSQTLNGLISTFKAFASSKLGAGAKPFFNIFKDQLENFLLSVDALPSEYEKSYSKTLDVIAKYQQRIASVQGIPAATEILENGDRDIEKINQAIKEIEKLIAPAANWLSVDRALAPWGGADGSIRDYGFGSEAELKRAKEELKKLYSLRDNVVALHQQATDNKDQYLAMAETNEVQAILQNLEENSQKIQAAYKAASSTIEQEKTAIAEKLTLLDKEYQRRAALIAQDADQNQENLLKLQYKTKRIALEKEQLAIEERMRGLEDKKRQEGKAAVNAKEKLIAADIEILRQQRDYLKLLPDTVQKQDQLTDSMDKERSLLEKLSGVWLDYAEALQLANGSAEDIAEAKTRGMGYQYQAQGLGLSVQTTDATLLEKSQQAVTGTPNANGETVGGLGDDREHFQTLADGAKAAVWDYMATVGTLGDQMHRTFTDLFGSIESGFSSSIEGLINGTMSWNDALMNIRNTILGTLVQSFAQMAVQWIAQQILMATVGKGLQAMQLKGLSPIAAKTTALWMPAATASSIATLGQSAISGAFMAKLAVGASSMIPGFSEGGYTGDGATDKVAGLVHAQEFVINAGATAQFRPLLERINRGQNPVLPSRGSEGVFANSSDSSPTINIAVVDRRNKGQDWLNSNEGKKILVDLTKTNRSAMGIPT